MAYTNGMNAVSEYAQFYNSDNHDRVYDADSMAEWLTPFFVDGIFNGQMQVTANNNMTVSVAPGFGYIDGKVKHFPSSTILNIDLAHAQYQRIDLIVLRRDDAQRDFFLDVVKGEPAQNPVPPTLTRNNTIWELQLATVTVPVGATSITQSAISDTRMDSSVCGWVAATVEEIDFDQIKAQFDTWYEEFTTRVTERSDNAYDEAVAEFNAWFQRMKDQLSTDAAGNLQAQIDDLADKVETDIKDSIEDLRGYTDDALFDVMSNLTDVTSAAAAAGIMMENNSDSIITITFDDVEDFSDAQKGLFYKVATDTAQNVHGSGLVVSITPAAGAQSSGNNYDYFKTIGHGLYFISPGKDAKIRVTAKYAEALTYRISGSTVTAYFLLKQSGGEYGEPVTSFTTQANEETEFLLVYPASMMTADSTFSEVMKIETGNYVSKSVTVAISRGGSSFTSGSVMVYILKDIDVTTRKVQTKSLVKKALPSLVLLQENRETELLITNNALDANPVWEACEPNKVHVFNNATSVNSPAIAVRIKSSVTSLQKWTNQRFFTGMSIAVWY